MVVSAPLTDRGRREAKLTTYDIESTFYNGRHVLTHRVEMALLTAEIARAVIVVVLHALQDLRGDRLLLELVNLCFREAG